MPQRTVLVVEDDPAVAQLLMMALRSWEYDAIHAATSRQALDFARLHQNEIALVVCDVNLQGETGPAVAARIRAICPRTATLFTSGFPFDVLCECGLLTPQILQNGDTGYIQKPFPLRDLNIAINRLSQPATRGPSGVSQTEGRHAGAAY